MPTVSQCASSRIVGPGCAPLTMPMALPLASTQHLVEAEGAHLGDDAFDDRRLLAAEAGDADQLLRKGDQRRRIDTLCHGSSPDAHFVLPVQ